MNLFKENRVIYQTDPLDLDRESRKLKIQAGNIIGEKLAGAGTFEGKTAGAIANITAANQPTTIDIAVAAAEKPFTPTRRTDARGDVWETIEGRPGTEKLVEKGARTPTEASKERADEIRGLLSGREVPGERKALEEKLASTANQAEKDAIQAEIDGLGKGITDAGTRDILNAELRSLNQNIFDATTGLDVREQDIAQGKKDTLAAMQKRKDDIRTKEGEAGRKIEREIGAVLSRFTAGAEGAASSTDKGVIEGFKAGGEKRLQAAIAADPELANLRSRLTQLSTGERNIEKFKKETSSKEFESLMNFFTDADAKLDAAAKENLKFLTDNPGALASASVASVEAALTKAGRDPSVASGWIAEAKLASQLKGIEREQAEADLAASIAKAEQAALSDSAKAIADFDNLQAALNAGEISQAFFDRETLGVDPTKPVSRLDKLKADQIEIENQILQAERDADRAELEAAEPATPSGEIVTTSFENGRNIKIDAVANPSLNAIDQSAAGQEIGINGQTGLVTAAIKTSGFRSRETQAQLYQEFLNGGALAAAPGTSLHEKGLAIDLFNVGPDAMAYIEKMKPIMNSNGWFQNPDIVKDDPSHFEFKGNVEKKIDQEVEDKVNSILRSTGQTTSGISTKDDLRSRVETRLSEKQDELRAEGDIRGVLAASAGGSKVDSSFLQRFSKGKVVVNQLDELTRALTSNQDVDDIEDLEDDEGNKIFDFSPITGWVRSKNPWDANAQEINAIIQGAIPNLARGVFGEVGVLTDHDVELYRKTLPTLNQTDEVKKLVAGLTMRVVRNSLEESLLTYADNGRNVSGNIRYLDDLDRKIASIESQLGIAEAEFDLDALFQEAETETPGEFNSFFENL